ENGAVLTLGGAAAAFALTEDEKRAAQAALDAEAEAQARAAAATNKAAAERRSSASADPARSPKPLVPPAVGAKVAQDIKAGRVSQTQARAPIASAANPQRRRSRGLLPLLFLLFVVLLPFAIPLLCDRARAQVALGSHVKLAVAGFTVLSVIA